LVSLTILASLFASAQAGCDNACSGHGVCTLDGVCQCYDNWGMGLSHDSGDCSDRICPYEIAWIDTPDANGQRHKYQECAGRGICNRQSGDCECFPGYEGKGCQRAVCPNSCSGHGQCKYIQDMPYQESPYDYFNNAWGVGSTSSDFLPQDAHTFPSYKGWDVEKTRGCVCDPEWGDFDCSKHMCPYGTDIMDHRQNYNAAQKYQSQYISFVLPGITGAISVTSQIGNTFALTFKSRLNETYTTIPIVYNASTHSSHLSYRMLERDVKAALTSLPNNVIDGVSVAAGTIDSLTTTFINVTFTGDNVQGKQNLLTVRNYVCGDGCTPKLSGLELTPGYDVVKEVVAADFNSYECGRRGKCNYDTGVCQCFAGYTGNACNTITALV